MSNTPEHSGVTWFGDPLADGTVFVVHGERGLAATYFELCIAVAKKNGFAITPELESEFQRMALEREAEEMAKVRARGIAGNIRRLLGAKRKKDAVRWARDTVLDARDFTDLIMNPGAVGLSHYAKVVGFVPEARQLTAEEDEALFSSAGSGVSERIVRKVRQIFVERGHQTAHLFADSLERWHLFVMSLTDILGHPLNVDFAPRLTS